MKEFNTTGVCIPSRHYMADPSDKVRKIRRLVDAGKYFVISLPGQYGKTTTLIALREMLIPDYDVLMLDFQEIGGSGFATEEKFVQEISRLIWNRQGIGLTIPEEISDRLRRWKDSETPHRQTGRTV